MQNMMINMYFVARTKLQNFIFENLDINGAKGLVAVCIVVFLVTFFFEALKLIQIYCQLRVRQHPLSYAKFDSSTRDRSDLLSPLLIPVSIQQIRQQRLKYHAFGCLSHMLNLSVGYFIMLAFMTYNVWLGISVIFGATLGYFIFGAIGNQLTRNFTEITSKQKPVLDSESIVNRSTEDNFTAIQQNSCHI